MSSLTKAAKKHMVPAPPGFRPRTDVPNVVKTFKASPLERSYHMMQERVENWLRAYQGETNLLNDFQIDNTLTRPLWEEFRVSRTHITEQVRYVAKEMMQEGTMNENRTGNSICVLGAGNCNNFSLEQFNGYFDRVVLVDIDKKAMEAGVKFQLQKNLLPVRECVSIIEADITDMYKTLSTIPMEPSSVQIAEIKREISEPYSGTKWISESSNEHLGFEKFDVVLSANVAHEITKTFQQLTGTYDNPIIDELDSITDLLMAQHIRTINSLLKPEGVSLLVVEILNSHLDDALMDPQEVHLHRILNRNRKAGNMLPSTDPEIIKGLLESMEGVDQKSISSPEKVYFEFLPNVGRSIFFVNLLEYREKRKARGSVHMISFWRRNNKSYENKED